MKSNFESMSGSKLSDSIEIIPLGGGCEVGRSCILLKFKGKTVMLDCGLHPSDNDMSSLPFFDKINPVDVDLLLVTHFHLDHCGSIPYFLEKTNFKGKTIMTYPTKAIYKHLLLDSLKVGNHEENKSLYGVKEIMSSLEKIKAVNFHEEIEYKDIKFTAYNAGHVIGAAMFIIEIAGTKILYTGDYSREEDMHIIPAEIPKTKIDILIVESTYGVKTHEPRERREKYFLETVEKIVKRNGKCLLPVFVLGRAQELLLMLDNYWNRKEELQSVPIYYASTLMGKCMLIFQTYINMMGKNVKERMKKGDNPFDFKFIKEHKGNDFSDDSDKSVVVMASPGMLQKGLSRTLFQKWCPDEKNGVVLTGYCVENTLAYDILHNGKREFTKDNGQVLQIKMSIEYISFSAHADMIQTKEFIEKVMPKLVVLVHGEKHEAMKLKKELENTFGDKIIIKAPSNWETVEMKIAKKEKCKLLGDLVCQITDTENQLLALKTAENNRISIEVDYETLLFKKNFKYYICKESEAENFIEEKNMPIKQRVHLRFRHSMELVAFLVPQIFPGCKIYTENGSKKVTINEDVLIYKISKNELVLEWVSSEKNDITGDCVGYFIFELEQYDNIDMFYEDPFDPETKRLEQQKTKVETLIKSLEKNFETCQIDKTDLAIIMSTNEEKIMEINLENFEIGFCKNEILRKRIENIMMI